VSDIQQRFEFLAAQFERFVRDLETCRSREQRWLLLGGMIRLIEEIDRLILAEQLAGWDTHVVQLPSNPHNLAKASGVTQNRPMKVT